MKNVFLVVALLIAASTVSGQTKEFKGEWFQINYPASFKARSSLKAPGGSKCESAFFASPDGTVEFYIFSPQWKGNPTDIALKSNEKMADNITTKKGNKTIVHWTISANDKSYTRSYEEKKDEETNMVVGIKYKDTKAYDKYKKQYLAFKASLVQYAD